MTMVEKVEKHVCKHHNVHRLTEQMFLWCKPNNIQVCIVTYGTVESKLCRQNYIIGNCDEFSLIHFTKFHIQKKNSRFCVHINYNHYIFPLKTLKSLYIWFLFPSVFVIGSQFLIKSHALFGNTLEPKTSCPKFGET